jgi:MFS family permease
MQGATEQQQLRLPTAMTRAWAINGLGLYVLVMYGITYYAITTSAPQMAADLEVPVSAIFGLLTVSLLASAGLAPYCGRWTDRFGAAAMLLIGATLRAVALGLTALAGDVWLFAAAFLAVQILGLATEYDATFAAAVDLGVKHARTGMSQITLWGGLASTVFWPMTAVLLDYMSWRSMLLIFAAVLLSICVPIAALLRQIPRVTREPSSPLPKQPKVASPLQTERRATPSFVLVAAAFAFGGFAYNLPSLMLPVLDGLGLGASAVLVGMLFGPAQTAGRFCDMLVGNRVHPLMVAVMAAASVALSLVILPIGGVSAGLTFALLFGAGAGVGYVVRGSVILALYGASAYATQLGRLGSLRLTVAAASPLLLSVVLENFGARAVVLVCGIATLLSLTCFVLLARGARHSARVGTR